ncbi:unnamed protein product, partial [Staurois parvus]
MISGTDDQCALMISVAPAVPPVSAHQCHLPVSISATSMSHISAYQCPSMPPASVHQCHINATYQCPSELLSVPVSAIYQCQSVPPISAANQ